METLLTETPNDLTSFRAWVRRSIDELTPSIDSEPTSELLANVAQLVRRAKRHAYAIGLHSLADQLPWRELKCPVDGLLRLRECATWNEPAPALNGPLNVQGVAAYLNISVRVVRGLITSGALGHFRAGRQIRVLPAHIEAYQQRDERRGFTHLFR